MRTLKTPDEIIEDFGYGSGLSVFAKQDIARMIIAAQRDALEYADDMANKFQALMSKLAENDLPLAEFTEAWNALLEFRSIQLENLLPKEK